MKIGSVRHDLALQSAKQKILRSKLSLYAKELYLYGSAARGEVLKVVFGNGWRTSTQTYYKNIVQEGKNMAEELKTYHDTGNL